MKLVYAVFAVLTTVLLPASAFAWGPGMHIDVAMEVIAGLSLAAPFIRELIKRFPKAYLYGAASPDIVVGKKYAGWLHHCHSWRMGWLILHEAVTDRQRAAAYGYLTHLAADVVAHNYYIPAKIVRSYEARLLTHTYWEMRFDLGVRESVWDEFKKITELDIEEFDDVMERVLRKTIFSFSTNKRIFSTILMLQKMKSLRRSLKVYAKRSRFDIVKENRQHYKELTMESVFNFLKNPEKAACLEVDPVGTSRMTYAKNLRKRIRRMIEFEFMTETDARKLIELVREELAVGLYRPDMYLPDVVDVIAK